MRKSQQAGKPMLGIIGGSGLYDIDGMAHMRETVVRTPFGRPSDAVVTGMVGGVPVAFLSRHGRGHRVNPTAINYRANLYALKSLGVQRVISVSAVGSMKEAIKPGDVVLPDQFIDLTKRRAGTFFDEGIVAHVAFAEPVCRSLSDSLAQAAQWASGYGVTLALEFRGADAFCSCLDTALSLVEQCREPNVGVCLDVFHYYKGPSKPEDLDRLTARNLAHVQVCDVAGVPRELMTDADRVMPGDGDFRLEPVVRKLREIGYAGYVSLELMNPVLWQSNPVHVAELGMAALRRLLGPAHPTNGLTG